MEERSNKELDKLLEFHRAEAKLERRARIMELGAMGSVCVLCFGGVLALILAVIFKGVGLI